MSALKDMVTGGADCSGSNNPLAKLLPQISGAAAMRENQHLSGFHPAEQEFRSMQMMEDPQVLNGPLMNMGDLSKELNGLALPHDELIHHRHQNSIQGGGFAEEFMQLNHEASSSSQFPTAALRSQQRSEWTQEFSDFSVPRSIGSSHLPPGVGVQFHQRPFMPMIAPAPLVPQLQPAVRKPSLDNAQWAAGFEQAMSQTKAKENRVMDDMARTAGMLLDSVDVKSNEKFKKSSFMQLMQGFRDGELKVEGNKIVEAGEAHDETSQVGPKDLAQNWTEEFIESQEAHQLDTGKGTLTELEDDEFEQAFKFTNWVDDYKDQIRGMTEDPQDIKWDELQKDWEKYDATGKGYRASNPMYNNYEFSQTNPFINAPLPVIEAAMTNQELSEALLALEAKVQQTPEDASAWHMLGLRQQQNEREAAAIAALRQAVSLDPGLCDAWLALAVSYTNESCIPDAYDSLESWIRNNPKYHNLLQGRLSPPDNQRHDYVFELFLDAVRSNTDGALDPEVQIGLGVLLNISEEYDKAVDCFQAALSTRPDDYLLWNKLGATLANSQEPTKAIEAYFRALELNPTFIRARYNLAISSINLGQYQEATEHLLAALALQLQERETALPAEIGGSLLLPHEVSSTGSSSHVWDTLRMTLYMLDRADLVEKCDAKDLDAFRNEFAF